MSEVIERWHVEVRSSTGYGRWEKYSEHETEEAANDYRNRMSALFGWSFRVRGPVVTTSPA
jgi:hypothetical protein